MAVLKLLKLDSMQLKRANAACRGITLVESMMAIAIGGLMMAGIVNGFIQCMRSAE